MIVGVQAIPACFDVEQNRFSYSAEALDAHFQSYDTLLSHPLHTDSAGRQALDTSTISPALAERYDASADGLNYNLVLRRGVRSATGHELSAHDVKWSWERAFALSSWSARVARRCGLSTADAVRVIQPYVVQFRLPEANSRFPAILTEPFPPVYDLETVRAECPVGDPWGNMWLRSHTAGFGPYVLDGAVLDQEASLSANIHCWRGAPRERTVLLRAMPESARRAEALLRGGIDIATDLTASEAGKLKENAGVRLVPDSPSKQIVLRVDTDFAPFTQPKVLQALTLGLPYGAIAQVLDCRRSGGGAAEQDHRTARTLLSEAGYGSGFRLTLFVPRDEPELLAAAQAVQHDVIRLNLKVVIETLDTDFFAREKGARHLPVYLEYRRCVSSLLTPEDLEPLPEVTTIIVAQPPSHFAARANIEGFVRRPDGWPRYAELRKS